MNKIFLDGKRVWDINNLEQFDVKMLGDDNRLDLTSFVGSGKIYIYISGHDNVFSFGKNNVVNNDMGINYWNSFKKEPCGSRIVIGDNNYFNGSGNSIIAPLTTELKIGDGNMFAGHIKVWGRNDHIIYDKSSRKRLNNDCDINLGSNNWICEGVKILPGAGLKQGSVLALGSILNSRIEKSNVLIAGVPARVKREGIAWSRACNYEDIDFNNNVIL